MRASFSSEVHADRIDRARTSLRRRGLDALLVSVGSDLPYLTGYEAMPLERLTMAVIPVDGPAVLVVPELEAPRVLDLPGGMTLRPWSETEDPVGIVAGALGGARSAALGDQTWSVFALRLLEAFPAVQLTPAGPVMAELRIRKSPGEIDRLRAAGAAADRVAVRLADVTFAGRTEADVSRRIGEMLIEEGHETVGFAIVGSGPNGASPHHEPGDRVLHPGDQIVLDFGGGLGGYCSDTTRNVSLREPSSRYREVFEVVLAAHDAALGAARPGVTAESVDAAAREVITDAGYGEAFIHRTGHGIGLDAHEEPYLVAGNERALEPGMTFSIEPGVYLPGEFGVRIEDIVAVTDDGIERLNRSPREVLVLGE